MILSKKIKRFLVNLQKPSANKAHQARPQAGWTSVPALVLRLSLTLPQNNHLHCGPCGRRYVASRSGFIFIERTAIICNKDILT